MTVHDFKIGDIVHLNNDGQNWFGRVTRIEAIENYLVYKELNIRGVADSSRWQFSMPGTIRHATEIEKALYL